MIVTVVSAQPVSLSEPSHTRLQEFKVRMAGWLFTQKLKVNIDTQNRHVWKEINTFSKANRFYFFMLSLHDQLGYG